MTIDKVDLLKETWRRGHLKRHRDQSTIGTDPLLGMFPYYEKLARRSALPIVFPETVVYEHHFPRGWYWLEKGKRRDTESEEELLTVSGDILQSVKSKGCETAAITESLIRGTKEGQIAAQVVRRDVKTDEISVVYLDPAGLRTFLMNLPDSCLLSKFIQPLNGRNETITVTWAQDKILIARSRNTLAVSDLSKNIQTRADTSSADSTTPVLSSSLLSSLITSTVTSLIAGVEATEKRRVIDFEAVFKLDTHSKLWLLHVTKLCLIPNQVKISCVSKFVPGDPDAQRHMGLTPLQNTFIDVRKKKVETALRRTRIGSGGTRARFNPFTITGIKAPRASCQEKDHGCWPSFWSPPTVQNVDLEKYLSKQRKRVSTRRSSGASNLDTLEVFFDITNVDTNNNNNDSDSKGSGSSPVATPPPSSESERESSSFQPSRAGSANSVVYPKPAVKYRRKRGASAVYINQKNAYDTNFTEKDRPSLVLQTLQAEQASTFDTKERRPAVAVRSGSHADTPLTEEEEKVMLIEALSAEKRKVHEIFSAQSEAIKASIHDIEYTAYSRMLNEKGGVTYLFDLPPGCPSLGPLQDLNIVRTSPLEHAQEYAIVIENQPPLMTVRQTMKALKERVWSSLHKSELAILLKGVDNETLQTLRHHRIPVKKQRSPTMSAIKTPGLFTIRHREAMQDTAGQWVQDTPADTANDDSGED